MKKLTLYLLLLFQNGNNNNIIQFKDQCQTANEVPQPQVVDALGFVNVKPLLFKPPW